MGVCSLLGEHTYYLHTYFLEEGEVFRPPGANFTPQGKALTPSVFVEFTHAVLKVCKSPENSDFRTIIGLLTHWHFDDFVVVGYIAGIDWLFEG
jgi:hypothetical protein